MCAHPLSRKSAIRRSSNVATSGGILRKPLPFKFSIPVLWALRIYKSMIYYQWNRFLCGSHGNMLSHYLSNDNVAVVHVFKCQHFSRLLQALCKVTLTICSCFHHCSEAFGLAKKHEIRNCDASQKREKHTSSHSKGALSSSKYLLGYSPFQHPKLSRVECRRASRCSE